MKKGWARKIIFRGIAILLFSVSLACVYIGVFNPKLGLKVAMNPNFLSMVYFFLASIYAGAGVAPWCLA